MSFPSPPEWLTRMIARLTPWRRGASRLDAVRPERGESLLRYAQRLGDEAATVGFDWEEAREALDKVVEEAEELRVALAEHPTGDPAIADELGDLIFASCMVARKAGVDAESALLSTMRKFRRRFAAIERTLEARGIDAEAASLEEMEQIWQQAKRAERA